MRLAIIGAEGQFGRSLREGFAGQEMLLLDLPQWDITSEETISFLVRWASDVVTGAGSPTYIRNLAEGISRLYPGENYPRPVKPPHAILANVRAAKLGIRLRPWREALVAHFQGWSDGD